MAETVVYINCKLVRDGAKDIDLTVHSYLVGRPSHCIVIIEDGNGRLIGGDLESVEQSFQDQVANHPGYVVKGQWNIIAIPKAGSLPSLA